MRLVPCHLVGPTALAALIVFNAPATRAQASDGTHWSIFAGRSLSPAAGADRSFGGVSENFGIGASVEFQSRLLPIPLRVSVAYDKFRGGPSTTYKVTAVRAEGIFRPVPSVLGVRPYLLGGFGIATQSPTGMQVVDNGVPTFLPIARRTAIQLNAGAGLEFRRFFVEYRRSPFTAAGSMPAQSGQLNLGMRF